LRHCAAPAPALPLGRCRLDRPLLGTAPSIVRHVTFRPAVAPRRVEFLDNDIFYKKIESDL
jgi:hypothetical protein